MQDAIEKTVELSAPVERVWRALTDYREFGTWFRVALENPFEVGKVTRGVVTYPGHEGVVWESTTVTLEPESLFAFTWQPAAEQDGPADSKAPDMLVEFRLEPTEKGTRLTIRESGFASLPEDRQRIDLLRSNTEGWNIQAENIARYVQS